MKNFNSMADDYNTSQSNLAAQGGQEAQMMAQQQQQQQQFQHQQEAPHQQANPQHLSGSRQQMIVDEMSQDLQYLSREAPLDGGESTFGVYSQLGGGSQHGLSGYGQQREDSPSQLGGAAEHHLLLRDDEDFDQDDQQQLRRLSQLQQFNDRNNLESPTSGYVHNEQALEQLAPDNVDIQRPLQQAGDQSLAMDADDRLPMGASAEADGEATAEHEPVDSEQVARQNADAVAAAAEQIRNAKLKPFLVSFMVDARGGAMRGCRHSGVRIIIPPNSAPMPMRITCRYLRRERLVHPPPLMEGEACASKIMEVGPAGAKFLGPVLIEVPHFASLRGKEREIIILRSDSGEVWREHMVESDDNLVNSIIRSAEAADREMSAPAADQENVRPNSALSDQLGGNNNDGSSQSGERRLTRIVTNEFPQYFAIISRIRQEVHTIGPNGTTVDSQVVPRVQTIFTEGALTKRIKIGLQQKGSGKKTTTSTDIQAQTSQDDSQLDSIISSGSQNHQAEAINVDRPASPETAALAGEQRPGSPQSNQSRASQQRPGSAGAKRRSKFLACFGAGQGSVDLLNGATDESSAGGDSPRQSSKVAGGKRFRLDGDSDGETHGSPSPNGSLAGKQQQQEQQLVPEDYYIEHEPALILNVEPKTYGKRLASSSAQTDNKLNVTGFLSTSARTPKKRGGLLRKRRNKTQMTIHCDAPAAVARPKSAAGEADSSLEMPSLGAEQQQQQQDKTTFDDSIQDVITSDDHKWRTCTIQTDSDSVTVNYVTIAGDNAAAAGSAVATKTIGTGTQDDGYVSGSGDINRQSSFGKGLFSFGSGSADKQATAESKKARKQRAKASKKQKVKEEKLQQQQEKQQQQQRQVSQEESKTATMLDSSSQPLDQSIELQPISITTSASLGADDSIVGGEQANVAITKLPSVELVNESAAATVTKSSGDRDELVRSTSPSSKELKSKSKLERQEKQRREKEEKRLAKEQEELDEKLRKKQEKEAKEAERQAKKAEKQAAKLAKRARASPTAIAEVSPATPQTTSASPTNESTIGKTKTASVKFASDIVESVKDKASGLISFGHKSSDDGDSSANSSPKLSSAAVISQSSPAMEQKMPVQQLDSIQQVIESTTSKYEAEKERLSQEDGRDMVKLSLGLAPSEQPSRLDSDAGNQESLIAFSDSENDPSKSLEVSSSEQEKKLAALESSVDLGSQQLKPILKQASIASSGAGEEAEITISEPKSISSVVAEASDEAVKQADALKAAAESGLSKKELKAKAKLEAKAKADEIKRLAKEAKESAKREADALAKEKDEAKKKAAEEAKKLADQVALEAKEAKAAAKTAKEAAKAAAKQAKLDLKLAAKAKKSDHEENSPKETVTSSSSAAVEASSSSAEGKSESESPTKAGKSLIGGIVSKLRSTTGDAIEATGEAIDDATEDAEKLKMSAKEEKEKRAKEAKEAKEAIKAAKEAAKAAAKQAKLELKLAAKAKKSAKAESSPKEAVESSSSAGPQVSSSSAEVSKVESEAAKESRHDGDDLVEKVHETTEHVIEAAGEAIEDATEATKDLLSSASPTLATSEQTVSAPTADKSAFVSTKTEATEESAEVKDKETKRAKKKKEKKEKKSKASKSAEVSESTEPNASYSVSKPSFFKRLFSSSSSSVDKSAPKLSSPVLEVKTTPSKAAPLIVSEMYPSDPDDANGEMILEVNVPQELIEGSKTPEAAGEHLVRQVRDASHVRSEASDLSEALPTSTTIDETLEASKHKSQPQVQLNDDQEATLLNISQMINSEADDDDATENVLSQQEDLTVASVASPKNLAPPSAATITVSEAEKLQVSGPPSRQELEQVADEIAKEALEAAGVSSGDAETSKTKVKKTKKTKEELREEKARKELEVKLEKEAKKRAKEEEKANKKLAKEAEEAAKKAAREAKKREKEAAKEAKRLAELAKKQAKADAKLAKKSKVAPAVLEVAVASAAPVEEVAVEGADIDTSNMTPVNTETEVERIVEEVVGEDGTVTKTTRTVETKYVTLRSEELRTAERREMPIEEYERELAEVELEQRQVEPAISITTRGDIVETRVKPLAIAVPAYEHAELEAIRSTPSYFTEALPAEIPAETAAKKVMKKRIKLNNKLIKRAHKLARVEAKRAKKSRGLAEAEISVCDEAARRARKQLKRAIKEAKRASKVAAKEHKKMDKVDKKLAKNQRKIEKRQAKLDKQAAKLAKKLEKRRAKEAKKEAKRAKKLERKSSQKSLASGSRKSIKLEDIGEPILRSTSKVSLSGAGTSGGQVITTTVTHTSGEKVVRRMSPTSDDMMRVEMSLEDGAEQMRAPGQAGEPQVVHTITRTVVTEGPDGQVSEQVSEQVLTGQEALEAAQRMRDEFSDDGEVDEEAEEEIDVVNDLPQIDKSNNLVKQPEL